FLLAFSFNKSPTTSIYTLSLHDALPIFSLVALSEESWGQAYTIQVAQDRSSDERVERNFALLFIIVLSGSVLASAFIAVIVTKRDRKSTRLNSSHDQISYAVFCLKKKKK